jgi:hypothetical protein
MSESAGHQHTGPQLDRRARVGAHRLTDRQIEAVYAVMRLLRDDRAVSGDDEAIHCDRCRRERPRQGSIAYGRILLCNGCATDYELLRTAGDVRRIEEFVRA